MTAPVNLSAERAKRAPRKTAAPQKGCAELLQLTGDGRVRRSLANVMTILSEDPAWRGVLAYDAFAEAIVSIKPPPVRPQDRPSNHSAGEWSEADSVRAAAWLSEHHGIDVAVQTVEQAVMAVARRQTVHPVRDCLRSLEWDGQQRLPTVFSKYFGTIQSDYSEAIGIRFFVSAVARVMQPGCKVDHLVVLEGRQGIGKSTAAKLLAMRPEWFSETGITLGDKDSYQNLRGKWVTAARSRVLAGRHRMTQIGARGTHQSRAKPVAIPWSAAAP